VTRRVILTYGRSLQTLAAARSLADQGLEVIVCDDSPLMAASFSRHVEATFTHAPPHHRPDQFIDDLIAGIERLGDGGDQRPVLMPMHTETRQIARHRDRLEQVAVVAGPDWSTIQTVWPKHRLVRTARDADVPHPKTRIIDDGHDAEGESDGVSYPLFVKAAATFGARGVKKVDEAAELDIAVEHVRRWAEQNDAGPLMLQQAVDGKDFCFTGLWRHGELIAHMTYRNLQMLPPSGGTGVLRETVEAPSLLEPASRLMKQAGWHGVAQVDFRWTGDEADTPHLIEVNPRFWAGLYQSIASGVDFPAMLYRLTVGEPIGAPPRAEVGTRTAMPLAGLYAAVRESFDDRSFDRLADAWRQVNAADKRQAVWPALKAVAKAMVDVINPAERVDRLTDAIQPHLTAEVEALDSDDPLVPLGLLYIVGSLVRHGRLPQELQ